ncbi:protein phosphatase CheZ [Azospirillum sp. sgz302134]
MNDVPLLELTELDYLQMEEALSQTARGRAFLRMRDRRSRVIAMDELHRVTAALEQQVNRLRGAEPGTMARASGDGLALQQELTAITQVVRETRSDIAALRPADTGSNRIEAATGELDEIVGATERATTDILNATEKIQEITQCIPREDPEIAEMVDAIEAWCIEIMTACSFQDITGQRTTKVVNTLRYIEQRVNTMIEIWGVERIAAAPTPEEVASHRKIGDTRPDAHLLNGPQLGGPEVSQDDIDALFDGLATQIPHVMERAEPATKPAAPPPPAPPPVKPAPRPAAPRPAAPPPEPSGGGEISQSDIDALFA